MMLAISIAAITIAATAAAMTMQYCAGIFMTIGGGVITKGWHTNDAQLTGCKILCFVTCSLFPFNNRDVYIYFYGNIVDDL